MPGNVAPPVAVGVLPYARMQSHTEQMQLECLVNNYPDGSSERQALALNPRHYFRVSILVNPAQWVQFWDFYRNHPGIPFYFYNLRETIPPFFYDPTGANPVGRYLVVFDSGWTEEIRVGRTQISFNLREVA